MKKITYNGVEGYFLTPEEKTEPDKIIQQIEELQQWISNTIIQCSPQFLQQH